MRTAFPAHLLAAAVAAVAALAGPAAAQKPKVKLTAARVGLPPGSRSTERDDVTQQAAHVCKLGAWAPIYLELTVEEDAPGPAEVVVESPDADEVTTVLTLPFSGLQSARPGQTLTARDFDRMPYVRPTAGNGEVVVRVRAVKGGDLGDPIRMRYLRAKDPNTYVVLSLGSRLPGFDLSKSATDRAGEEDDTGPLRGGRVETAAITRVDDLPDQWFGYDAADLVVLTTGAGAVSDDFLPRLFGDQASAADRVRRAALFEWVRRGGRLVVSVGSNAGLLAQMPAFLELLPFALNRDPASDARPSLRLDARPVGGRTITPSNLVPKGGSMPVARLTARPDRPARVLMPRAFVPGKTPALAAQAALGLGRVTVFAFDLDRAPFTESGVRADVWDWVLRACGADRVTSIAGGRKNAGFGSSDDDPEDALANALRVHTDTFDGVPVISFGWVAVFIVLYILLIGPVEYFLLKKVFGRLELTWVTFPVIVLTVSAVAYFTAYAVKGRDLKLNKVDVVDVDAAGGRVYGQTWFTLFSPRIDTYTVGVVPADGWSPDPPDVTTTRTLVGWAGGQQGGRASLVRRRYSYHVDPAADAVADGLLDVPIQVWSTKSFGANWTARLDPVAPAVASKLYHPVGDPATVRGTFTNRMPVGELRDAVAFYAGKAFPLGTVLPDSDVQLSLDPADTKLKDAGEFLKADQRLSQIAAEKPGGKQQSPGPADPAGFPMAGVLFHESALSAAETSLRNASLRRFDQSWRLDPEHTTEVVIVGRLAPTSGPADEAVGGPGSPSRLWLRALPAAGAARPPIPGTARQETWVRLFLPVAAAGD